MKSLWVLVATGLAAGGAFATAFQNGTIELPRGTPIYQGLRCSDNFVISWVNNASACTGEQWYISTGWPGVSLAASEETHYLSFSNDSTMGATLQQTFDTIVGQTYKVNYRINLENSFLRRQSILGQAFDGASLLGTAVANNFTNFDWEHGPTTTLTATSASTTLIPTETTPPASGVTRNWDLDGVTATTANAPSFAYIANQLSNEISLYNVDAMTGILTSRAAFPAPAAGSIVVTPSGTFAYVANYLSAGTVSAFTIAPSTGALTPVAGSPFAAGSYPYTLTLAPSGQFLYAANDGSNNVSAFSINPATGALSPVPGSPFSVGQNPYAVGLSPSGQFAYVSNAGSDSISAFTVNSITGALTPVPGSPFADPGVPRDTTANGSAPQFVAVEPSGHFVYISNAGSWTIAIYGIDQTTGALTAIDGSPIPTAPEPNEITFASPGFAYVTNSGTATSRVDGSVSVYSVNSTTGMLTQASGSPFASGADTSWVALGPAGFAYATNAYSDTVSIFSINPATGGLAPIASSPFTTASYPRAIAFVTPSTQGCVTSLSSFEQAFSTEGGLGSFAVNAGSTCDWNAVASASWIVILPSASKGVGKVNFAIEPNNGGGRTGTISVGGQTFTIAQSGFSCSYSIGPTVASLGDVGGAARTVVTAPAGCTWQATSNAAWISITSGAAGSGSGAVSLNVAANTGTSRSGTVTIAGQNFSVTEGAGACGAVDVTSEVRVNEGQLIWTSNDYEVSYYSQSLSVTNTSSAAILGPIYLVMLGLPTHYPFATPPQSGLVQLPTGGSLTTCFSTGGDYLIPISGGLQPGQTTATLFLSLERGGYPLNYAAKILSGAPSK